MWAKIPWSLMVFKLYSYNVIEAQAPPRLVPASTLIMCKVSDNYHILWIDKRIHYIQNRPHLLPQTILKVSKNTWSLVVYKRYHYNVVQAEAPPRLVPTSTLIMCKMFGNHQMLWMGIRMHHHPITTTLGTADLECELKFLVTGGVWMISLCCGWGRSPTQIGSHIILRHRQPS